MGWNCSLFAASDWPDDSLDSLMVGYTASEKKPDFDSACIDLGAGEIGIARLDSGEVVGVTYSYQEDLASIALMLSSYGKAGEFHLYSTACIYSYRLYEKGRVTEDRSSEMGTDEAFGMVDEDDALSLLDEEDGLGPAPLTEDGLLDLFGGLAPNYWSMNSPPEVVIYCKQTT